MSNNIADAQVPFDWTIPNAGKKIEGGVIYSTPSSSTSTSTGRQTATKDYGDGSACVPTDEGDCISKGIGYGMLIAVGFDDPASCPVR